MKDLTGTEKTKTGVECRNVVFNTCAKLYLGFVADPLWTKPDQPFVTCSWYKSGKCVNRNRPELDLK